MKKYMKPTIEVVELVHTAQLLSGSGPLLGGDYVEDGPVLAPDMEGNPLNILNLEMQ